MNKDSPPRKPLAYWKKRLKYIDEMYGTASQNDNPQISLKNIETKTKLYTG